MDKLGRKRNASSSASSSKKSRARSVSKQGDDDEVMDTNTPANPVPVELKPGSRRNSKKELRNSMDPTGLRALKLEIFEKIDSMSMTNRPDGFAEDVPDFRRLFNQLEDDEATEKRVIIDQFLRDYLLERSLANRSQWGTFLELSIKLAKEEISSPSLPIALVTDLVELSTLKACEGIFQFVEDHLNTWREPFFLNTGKNAVLRMCNDLLRRLSRAQNTIFCGRILIFLSNYFPFSERSGLNIMSEFNAENLTVYKTGDGSDDPDDQMEVAVERDEPLFQGIDINIPGLQELISLFQDEKKKGMAVDYNLYVKFWSLQDYFRNPLQCYNKIAWKTFTSYTGDVLGAFQCFKIEELPPRKRKVITMEVDVPNKVPSSSINIIPKLGDEDLYFAKYLTNRRLLELQMGDPDFRRYFMVQLLIVLQYLTLTVKFKGESNVLTDDQLEYIRKSTDKIYELLADIPPEGKEFVDCVQHILRREELWNKWKNDGCPIFKKPVVTQNIPKDSKEDRDDKLDGEDEKEKGTSTKTSSTTKSKTTTPAVKQEPKTDNTGLITGTDEISPEIEESVKEKPKKKKRQLGDIIKEATVNNKFLLGNSELTRLWNICPNNLEACRSKARDFMPPIEVFFAEAMKELDPEPVTVPDPKKPLKAKKILGNANFGWRALRLLARRSPYFFQMVSGSPIQPLQNYLEYVLKKIAADLEVPIGSADNLNNGIKNEVATPTSTTAVGEMDGEMEGGAEEDEELIKSEPDLKRVKRDEEDDEEGEVRYEKEKVRNLTSEERVALGQAIGSNWKKLAIKLGFTTDEVEFFEMERKDKAGEYMLTMWTEQEGEEATVAELIYTMEGLGLLAKDKVDSIFS